MTANPILLQKKYARVVACLAHKQNISLSEALKQFYSSFTYTLVRDGVSDLHCMSDDYIATEIAEESTAPPPHQ